METNTNNDSYVLDQNTPLESVNNIHGLLAVTKEGKGGAVGLNEIATEAGKKIGEAIKIDGLVLPTLDNVNKIVRVMGGSAGKTFTYTDPITSEVKQFPIGANMVNDLFWDKDAKTWSKSGVDVPLPFVQPIDGFQSNDSNASGSAKNDKLLNDLKANKTDLFSLSGLIYPYSTTVTGNGVSLVTAINNFPATKTGKINLIKGRFTGAGNLVLYICTRAVGTNTFTPVKKYNISILGNGIQEVNVSELNIAINIGEYVGIDVSSTSQPYYGTDATVGYGWFQRGTPITEGVGQTYSVVSSAVFAFSYEIAELKFANSSSVFTKAETNSLLFSKVNSNELFLNKLSNDLVALTGTQSPSASLMNNVGAQKSGYIDKVTINAQNAGTANFQILRRDTFNSTGAAGDKDSFSPTGKSFSIPNVVVGTVTYNLSEPVYIEAGEYVMMISEVGVYPVFNNSTSIGNHLGWWQAGTGSVTVSRQLTYQPFSILFNFNIREDLFQRVKSESSTVINKITLARNADNYNSLRELINSISDASEKNQYEIFVPAGEYFEVDLNGKKYVRVVGESRERTILYMDSTNMDPKYIAPADYHFTAARGKHLSEVDRNYLHVIFAVNDCYFKNLTIRAKRAKYPAHLDNNSYNSAYFENVRFKEVDECNYSIGIGVWSGQQLQFINCIVERLAQNITERLGVFIHNWNNQAKAVLVHFENTQFLNCGYAMIDELGSDQPDQFNFINCTCDGRKEFILMVDMNSAGRTYWTNPATGLKEPNPQNVPYCINLNTSGTEVERISSRFADGFGIEYAGLEQRELTKFLNNSITDYYGNALVIQAINIEKGDILAKTAAFTGTYSSMMTVKKFDNFTEDMEIAGIALESNQVDPANPVATNLIEYAPVGKIALAKISGSVLIANKTNKLIWDDANKILKSQANADLRSVFAIAIAARDTSGIHLLPVKLLK